ncbi:MULTISPECIES: hypothetical protein [Thermodesulfovibrio]|uniref:hypothetical protein n=1 Tax=Thermodesulfovibrio TaxID=28261 RepID=UPI002621E6F7|nr:hypothetical protein [Thermodesulfovibrio sp.]
MIRRRLVLIFLMFFIITPSIAFSEKINCKEALNKCRKENEEWYKMRAIFCQYSRTEYFSELCRSAGENSSKCIEQHIDRCKKEYLEDYRQSIKACDSMNRKCKKGDIFGIITCQINYDESKRKSTNLYRFGNTFVMISGFWKFQREESNRLYENYRPDELWISLSFAEERRNNLPNKGCPKLISYYQGGLSRIFTIDRKFDLTMHPLGRFIKNFDFSKELELTNENKKELAKNRGFYSVYKNGTLISIDGKEQVGTNFPECNKYRNDSINIIIGGFSIRDIIKKGSKMEGFKSVELSSIPPFNPSMELSCGYDYFQERTLRCPEGGCEGKTNIKWKFYEIN